MSRSGYDSAGTALVCGCTSLQAVLTACGSVSLLLEQGSDCCRIACKHWSLHAPLSAFHCRSHSCTATPFGLVFALAWGLAALYSLPAHHQSVSFPSSLLHLQRQSSGVCVPGACALQHRAFAHICHHQLPSTSALCFCVVAKASNAPRIASSHWQCAESIPVGFHCCAAACYVCAHVPSCLQTGNAAHEQMTRQAVRCTCHLSLLSVKAQILGSI